MWWFGGILNPENYPTRQTISVSNVAAGPYNWRILYGLAKFPNGANAITTTASNVEVIAQGTSGLRQSVGVDVTVNGKTSQLHWLTVRTPTYLIPFGDPLDYGSTTGPNRFESHIRYHIADQFSDLLPDGYPIGINENWTSNVVRDNVLSNWQRAAPNSVYANPTPFDWQDIISMPQPLLLVTTVPIPVVPQNSASWEKVMHWSGEFRVGSVSSGSGVRVQANTWQAYRGRGRHENRLTPAPEY